MGENTVGQGISHDILTSKVKLPPLSADAHKIFDMTRRSLNHINTHKLAMLVESDPGLYARILQLANSPYYSGVEKIISLRSAIVRIGLKETIDAINLYYLQGMMTPFKGIGNVTPKGFWAFSWVCAMANRRLGHPNLGGKTLPGELYISGLLHGVGKLLMAIHYPEEFTRCINKAKEFRQPLYIVEQEIFGTTDAKVASSILEYWNLPASICAGVAFCQTPELAPPEYREIAGLTQFSYAVASTSGLGSSGDGCSVSCEDTYLCLETDHKLAKADFRERLVNDVLAMVEEKAQHMTGEVPDPQQKRRPTIQLAASNPAQSSKKSGMGFFKRLIKIIFGIR